MKLTAVTAAERLKTWFPSLEYELRKGGPRLGRPLLYVEGQDILPEHFYLTDRPVKEPEHAGSCCFLFCGEASELSWKSDWIRVQQGELAAVFNALQTVFDELETWEEDLEQILERDGSVRELLERSHPVFQNPLAVVARDFSLTAQAGLDQFPAGAEFFRPGPEQMEYINALKEDELYNQMLETEGAFWYPGHIMGFGSWNVNLRRQGSSTHRLVLMEQERKLGEGDACILERLACFAGRLLYRKGTALPDSDSLRAVFKRILSDRTADYVENSHKISALGWGEQDSYLCLVFQTTYLDEKNLTANATCSYMEEWYSPACSFTFQKDIVTFFNLTLAGGDIEELSGRLKYFIRESFLKAGYSRVMQGHSNLRRQYVQATIALDVGSRRKPYLWIHWFNSVAFSYILEQSARRLPGYMLCHEGLLKLRKQDENQHTEYYKTLRIYLEENSNATQAARRLFIHRSTFLYRLERIKEILESELSDPEELLYLNFSYRLMEQEEAKDPRSES